MVRHATAKKRRRNVKVTRKPKKNEVVRIQNAVTNPIVKEVYDKNLTPKDNLAQMGLDANPNVKKTTSSLGGKSHAAFVGFATLADTDMKAIDANPKQKKISPLDSKYALACINAHGSDYAKMFRDIKVNYRQLTQNQLEKLCKKYIESLNE